MTEAFTNELEALMARQQVMFSRSFEVTCSR